MWRQLLCNVLIYNVVLKPHWCGEEVPTELNGKSTGTRKQTSLMSDAKPSFLISSLCNRCGLRWTNDRLPRDQIVPVKIIIDKASAQLKLTKPNNNFSPSRAERSSSQTQKQSKLSGETIALEHDRQEPSDRKKFLDAGLYSNEHNAQSIGRSSKAINSGRDFVFKLPEYHGECLLAKEVDFRLSYDIMDAFRRKQIGRVAEEYKQKSLKPNPYIKIRSSK